jgi:ribonuclease HII
MEVNELATLLATHSKENREDINAIFNELKAISTTVNEIKVQTTKTNGRVTALEKCNEDDSKNKTEHKGDRKYMLTTIISIAALTITVIVNFIIK